MGIVVSAAMLLALVMMLFNKRFMSIKSRVPVNLGIGFIALSGLWNSGWYGVQNVPFFWGIAALISGFFMLASVATFYIEKRKPTLVSSCTYCASRLAIIIGLSLYLLLYVVTIVQINLDMPIIH